MYKFKCEHMFSILLGICPQVKLLDHITINIQTNKQNNNKKLKNMSPNTKMVFSGKLIFHLIPLM